MKKWSYFWVPAKDLESMGAIPWEVVAVPLGHCDSDGNPLALMRQEFDVD